MTTTQPAMAQNIAVILTSHNYVVTWLPGDGEDYLHIVQPNFFNDSAKLQEAEATFRDGRLTYATLTTYYSCPCPQCSQFVFGPGQELMLLDALGVEDLFEAVTL